jgi:nucleotide-binding universal stress UspA family protein
MDKILVPVDFSETSLNALEQAVVLASENSKKIWLLHVIKPPAFFSQSTPLSKEEVQSKMNSLAEQYNDKGIKIHYEIEEGKPFKKIAEYANQNEIDMICMGTHGVSGFEEFWAGSNTYKVVSISPCPVISLRKGVTPSSFNKIILPIDNSKFTRQKVPFTAKLAARFNSSVDVIGITSDSEGDIFNKIQSYAGQVQEFISETGVNCRMEMLQGSNITKVTLQYAQRVNADLISIMTEQEVDPANIFLGPYAQQMVNHSDIPVLTSRPDDKLMGSVRTGY